MGKKSTDGSHHIGTLNEKPLHAALKEFYARPDDRCEVLLEGSYIDIVRGEMLIEIQTGSFSSIKRKLLKLTPNHPVRLVYPVAREKWIVRSDEDGKLIGRRKSPKRGSVLEVFKELVSFPELLRCPDFSIEVMMIREEEVRRHSATRGWRRRGWLTYERRLIEVMDRCLFETPADLGSLIPPDLAEPFTTAELSDAIAITVALAQKMTYCLRRMDVIEIRGKSGNAVLYAREAAHEQRTSAS